MRTKNIKKNRNSSRKSGAINIISKNNPKKWGRCGRFNR